MRALDEPHELPGYHHPPESTHHDGGPNAISTTSALRGLTATKVASMIVDALKPDILHHRKHALRSSTAWLDGLRGWAAFIVCIVHLTVYTHTGIELCYGAQISLGVYNNTPAAWPILRLLFSGGHFAVMIFFIISGYVLTRRLILLLHEGRREDFISAVHSSICRRPLRLYLPVMWSTLAFACTWHLLGIATPWPEQQFNIFLELGSWLQDIGKFFYFYRGGFLFTYYNIHTWTIPVELRGSMMVFVWLFAMQHVSTRSRILMTLGMTLYLVIGAPGAWYACFFAGMLTVETDLLATGTTQAVKLPWDGALKVLRENQIIRSALLHGMFVASLFLGSEPSGDNMTKEEVLGTCHGWGTLSRLIPAAYDEQDNKTHGTHRWFWLFWASWMLLVAVKEIHWLRGFFERRFSQYLGRLSFALYLIHGPMIGIFSERLFYLSGVKKPLSADQQAKFGHLLNRWSDARWWPFSNAGLGYGLETNFIFCVVVSVVVFLYVAELGTKMFDAPSLRTSRWVYIRYLKAV